MSGTDLPDGQKIRKGAVAAIVKYVRETFGTPIPTDLDDAVDRVARDGATPLAVAVDGNILGVIELSDVLKPHIRERAAQLRKMGIRTVMVTGDNPITAASDRRAGRRR